MKARMIVEFKIVLFALAIPHAGLPIYGVKKCVLLRVDTIWQLARVPSGTLGLLCFPRLRDLFGGGKQLIARFGLKSHQVEQLDVLIFALIVPGNGLTRSRIKKRRITSQVTLRPLPLFISFQAVDYFGCNRPAQAACVGINTAWIIAITNRLLRITGHDVTLGGGPSAIEQLISRAIPKKE